MWLRHALAIVAISSIVGLGALAVRQIADRTTPVDGASVVLALAVPRSTVHGERYVAYGGMRGDAGHTYVFRLCDDSGSCPVRRSGSVAIDEDVWSWLATYPAALPAGEYTGEFFLRAPDYLGVERTVEYFRWEHHVQ